MDGGYVRKRRVNPGEEAKWQFIENVIRDVHEIPVDKIVGEVVQLYPRGRHMMGLCPFHPDHRLGSFVVTPDKGLWQCFAEGIGGDGIKFVREYYGLSYLDAVFKLALEHDIITESEYKRYSSKRYESDKLEAIQSSFETKKPVYRKASDETISIIYEALIRESQMSEEELKAFKEERKLRDSEVKDYFKFPTRKANVYKRIQKGLSEILSGRKYGVAFAKLTKEQKMAVAGECGKLMEELPYVPGFFYNKQQEWIDFVSTPGIGLAVRDDTGLIRGIQIRRNTVKPGESRYVWFSSSFAQGRDEYEGGATPGCPGGVLFAKNYTGKNALCITEGRFKAEKISALGNTAIYVSGVSTWKSVLPIVERIKGDRKRIVLMFDSDVLGNVAVHKQLKALAAAVTELGLKPYVLGWRKSYGKGFDDLVINVGHKNYKTYLKYIPFNEFEDIYNKTLANTLKQYNAKEVKDVKSDDALAFTENLQLNMEDAMGLPK